MEQLRPPLCARCGAVLPPAPSGAVGPTRGSCPDCGLGYVVHSITAAAPTGAAAPPPRIADEHRAAVERRRRHENDALVARLDFTPYGLDASWTGRRWLGGHGGAPVVERVTLAHGDSFDDDAPLIRVETHRPQQTVLPTGPTTEHVMAAHSLVQSLWHATGEHSDAMTQTFRAEDPTAAWDATSLVVDGVAHPFRILRAGRHWVALGVLGTTLVGIDARAIAPDAVRLVQVDDLDVYLHDSGLP